MYSNSVIVYKLYLCTFYIIKQKIKQNKVLNTNSNLKNLNLYEKMNQETASYMSLADCLKLFRIDVPNLSSTTNELVHISTKDLSLVYNSNYALFINGRRFYLTLQQSEALFSQVSVKSLVPLISSRFQMPLFVFIYLNVATLNENSSDEILFNAELVSKLKSHLSAYHIEEMAQGISLARIY